MAKRSFRAFDRDVHFPSLQVFADRNQESVPEPFLHQFFTQMGAPYHAYEAKDPDAPARAVAEIDRLLAQPIRYVEAGAAHYLTGAAGAMALLCMSALLVLGRFDLHL